IPQNFQPLSHRPARSSHLWRHNFLLHLQRQQWRFFFHVPHPPALPLRTLTLFYPLAGQIKSAAVVDCSDAGAFFFDARVHCELARVLNPPDPDSLTSLLPTDTATVQSCSSATLLVQLSFFDCGGTALSVCMNHKIGDLSSLSTFLKCWAGGGMAPTPEFVGGSLLQARNLPVMPDMALAAGTCVTRRFVFSGEKIAGLREKINGLETRSGKPPSLRPPSRVESILALILKSAISASRSLSGKPEPAAFFQTVDLRRRMSPPLPDNTIGNLVWQVPMFIKRGEQLELHEFISRLRKVMVEFCDEKAKKLKGMAGFMEVMCSMTKWAVHFMGNRVLYRCSSWCRSPLYEAADFGWGRPVWVSSASQEFRNIVVLVDTKDGDGVEAWVSLDKPVMALLERDKEILEFVSLNPNIL
ncbi:Vinorine synthase, partial [Bertholletia excelsa]